MKRISGVMLAVALGLGWGCTRNSDEIDGPEPLLTAVSPDLLCVDQAPQEITITGAGLAPLVTDAAKDEVVVVLPQLVLTRTADLDGTVVSAADVVLAEDQIEWDSQTAVRTTLSPALGLAPGVYRLRVINGSGQETTLDGAVTLVPPPEVTAVAPDLFCGQDEAVELTVSGSGFVAVGDSLPLVIIGADSYPADSVGGCTELDDSALAAGRVPSWSFTCRPPSSTPAGTS